MVRRLLFFILFYFIKGVTEKAWCVTKKKKVLFNWKAVRKLFSKCNAVCLCNDCLDKLQVITLCLSSLFYKL